MLDVLINSLFDFKGNEKMKQSLLVAALLALALSGCPSSTPPADDASAAPGDASGVMVESSDGAVEASEPEAAAPVEASEPVEASAPVEASN